MDQKALTRDKKKSGIFEEEKKESNELSIIPDDKNLDSDQDMEDQTENNLKLSSEQIDDEKEKSTKETES